MASLGRVQRWNVALDSFHNVAVNALTGPGALRPRLIQRVAARALRMDEASMRSMLRGNLARAREWRQESVGEWVGGGFLHMTALHLGTSLLPWKEWTGALHFPKP